MSTAAITVKIDSRLQALLAELCAKHGTGKSELMRRALVAFGQSHAAQPSQAPIALSLVSDLAGAFEGGPDDLASNPAHLTDFGRIEPRNRS